MLNQIKNFYKQLETALQLVEKIRFHKGFTEVLILGMGGGSFADIIKCYNTTAVRIETQKDYTLPAWVSKKTLIFAVSYSGNTEETLSSLKQALQKKCKPILVGSGGQLGLLAKKYKLDFIQIPQGIQPRQAIGYQAMAVICALQKYKLLPKKNDLQETIAFLKKDQIHKGKKIAQQLKGKIPIIYSSNDFQGLAQNWKIQINENAKTPAFWNVFPELNHNEMVGFTKINGNYIFIFIEDKTDHPRIKKRMKITKQLFTKKGLKVIEVKITGKNRMAKIFSAIQLGMYVSYFLALENKMDPEPVQMVEEFKKKLKE
ncbi:MAG: bifunctional phosphoglucose/phosphomannose isomerase [Candidatus Diapherotrites archaeon]|nr:bifunctional phosphoglucose/phosphomannose isomerase [Candidatus Diapherotrites archaeon]